MRRSECNCGVTPGPRGSPGPPGPPGQLGSRIYGYFTSTTPLNNSDAFVYNPSGCPTGSLYTSELILTNVTEATGINGSLITLPETGDYKISYNIYLSPHGESGESEPISPRYIVEIPILNSDGSYGSEVYQNKFDYYQLPLHDNCGDYYYGSTIQLSGEFIYGYTGGQNIALLVTGTYEPPIVNTTGIIATLIIEKLN